MVSLPAALMIVSAVLHAATGLLMKQSRDKTLFRAMLALVTALAVIPLLFLLPIPPKPVWGYLLFGAALHFIYQMAQIKAFEAGDMSLVYPIMRGSAPALAAVFAFAILGETLRFIEISGLVVSVGALIAFGLAPAADKALKRAPQKTAIAFALFCGVMTALYSVVDGAGMRLNREMGLTALSYIAWFFLLDGIGLPLWATFKNGKAFITNARPDFGRALCAGAFCLISYSAALYAFSLAPIGKMAALRETSVVFGAIFAYVILKEPLGQRRIILAVILAIGLIVMQMG